LGEKYRPEPQSKITPGIQDPPRDVGLGVEQAFSLFVVGYAD
jgi:hypothetical protein